MKQQTSMTSTLHLTSDWHKHIRLLLTSGYYQGNIRAFGLINSDRAARGLYPFAWNNVLAGGARLHSWNMYHCGFSHTCPDGRTQCQRIADEGFAGYTDCGECIGYAGPYPTA